MDNHMDIEETVGYCKPPKHTQFKKGKSGNPKGRPPKKYIPELLEDILEEKVTITVNGEKRVITKKEAPLLRLVNDCMGGKSMAHRNLILLLRSLSNMHIV